MKKTLKIAGITLLSIVGLILVTLAVACWLIFTPARLTSIARKTADKYLLCESHIGKANLTLFKTFPQLGLAIDDFIVINPTEGAVSDTVVAVKELNASIDLKRLAKTHDIVVNGIDLRGGVVNLFTPADGTPNWNVFPKSQKEEEKEPFDLNSLTLDIDHISLEGINATYVNRKDSLEALARGLDVTFNGNMHAGSVQAQTDAVVKEIQVAIDKRSPLRANASGLTLKGNVDLASLPFGNASPTEGKQPSGIGTDARLTADSASFVKDNLTTALSRLELDMNGTRKDSIWEGTAQLRTRSPLVALASKNPLDASATELAVDAKGKVCGQIIELAPVVKSPDISFKLGKDQWLHHADVSIEAGILTDTILKHFNVYDGNIRLGQFTLDVDGGLLLAEDNPVDADVKLKTNQWDVPKFIALLPQSVRRSLSAVRFRKAGATLALDASGTWQKGRLNLRDADGKILVSQLDATVGDSISILTPRLTLTTTTPKKRNTTKFTEFLQGTLASPSIDAYLPGKGTISLASPSGTYGISDFLDKKHPFSALASLKMNTLNATLDTVNAHLSQPVIDALMTKQKGKPHYDASLKVASLAANAGSGVKATTQALSIKASALLDNTKKNALDKWNPDVDIQFSDGHAQLQALSLPLDIPSIDLRFTPGKFNIRQSNIHLGNSDFSLKGDITDLNAFINDSGLLKADLAFKSTYTDVTQILNLVSGLKAQKSDAPVTDDTPAAADDSEPMKEDNPFMVPTGVDVTLRTDIKTANWNGFKFHNVGGRVTCDDGALIAEELGFTSEAATMQLTAMYKSPRKNHLYAGLDFHLMDIEIDDLIRLIPKVDSIVPMLKSFDGQAQFHLAGETYMKSNYDLKLSTLRGAATIEGKDLVVLDNNTFATIKKYLMTDRKAENRIDSMDVELSVFRDEVDVYPFRIRLGEYEAIVGGRHNINKDFDFNYHISVTDCPLPVRLGLNVDGTLDDMQFKLVTPKYTNLYKPEKRGVVSARSMELKKVINESLKRNVKPIEYYSE